MNTYRISMSGVVLMIYFLAVAIVAGVATWAFRSGLTWTGICLAVVAGPMALIYWYMLYMNPARASIRTEKEGLHIQAPPFLDARVPYDGVERGFITDLKTDERMDMSKIDRAMRFGGYRVGGFKLPDGAEALTLTNKSRVAVLQFDQRYYVLGPDDFENFTTELEEKLGGRFKG